MDCWWHNEEHTGISHGRYGKVFTEHDLTHKAPMHLNTSEKSMEEIWQMFPSMTRKGFFFSPCQVGDVGHRLLKHEALWTLKLKTRNTDGIQMYACDTTVMGINPLMLSGSQLPKSLPSAWLLSSSFCGSLQKKKVPAMSSSYCASMLWLHSFLWLIPFFFSIKLFFY